MYYSTILSRGEAVFCCTLAYILDPIYVQVSRLDVSTLACTDCSTKGVSNRVLQFQCKCRYTGVPLLLTLGI